MRDSAGLMVEVRLSASNFRPNSGSPQPCLLRSVNRWQVSSSECLPVDRSAYSPRMSAPPYTDQIVLDVMEVKFDPRADCVLATFAGPFSIADLLAAFRKTYEAATDRGLGLILIDCCELDGTLTTHERFKLAESAAAYWSSKSARMNWLGAAANSRPKIAIVGRAPLVDGFGALAASNRGVNAKAFSELPHALGWLGLAL